MFSKRSLLTLAGTLLPLCLAGLQLPANSQTVITPLERPNATSITVPDVAGFKPTPKDVRNFGDYFYFHKSGVSYERAFADLEQCRINAAMAQVTALVPTVMPLGDAPTTAPKLSQNYFLFGGPLMNILIAEAEDENGAATNRKCMAYKGYRRYGTSRVLFKQVDSGTTAEKQARRALIASGPVPGGEAMEP
jgi:hypothetical protein